MQTQIDLPKAFSVRDEHESYPIQHLMARQGKRWAKLLQAIEMVVTFGGCPWGRARQKKYGVKPSEPLPPESTEPRGPHQDGVRADQR